MSSGGGAVLAAGTVVRRPGAHGTEVLLVHRPKYDDWSFPKGKLERGEPVLLAAVRETVEETGLQVRLERVLPTQRYSVSGRSKLVYYWAASVLAGEFVPNAEVDEVVWLPLAQARERLTWRRDEALIDAVERGPARTSSLLVLRHASPVARDEWGGDPDLRPLSALGQVQAGRLASLVATFAPDRVLSSDTTRALDTVRPYAEPRGITVEVTPLLSEAGLAAVRGAGAGALDALRHNPGPAVLCTHKAVVDPLLDVLFASAAVGRPRSGLAAGAMHVLHLAQGRVVAVEQHAAD